MCASNLCKACLLLSLMLGCLTKASADSTPELEREALGALSKLYSRNSLAAALGRSSTAVLVFPGAHMIGLGLAVQTATGVLFYRNAPAAYFNLTGFSLGLEVGVQKFDYAFFSRTTRRLISFIRPVDSRLASRRRWSSAMEFSPGNFPPPPAEPACIRFSLGKWGSWSHS
ncbi:MAG: hypothetical protein ACKOLA_02830, partial [Spartobacteria bacterium]